MKRSLLAAALAAAFIIGLSSVVGVNEPRRQVASVFYSPHRSQAQVSGGRGRRLCRACASTAARKVVGGLLTVDHHSPAKSSADD